MRDDDDSQLATGVSADIDEGMFDNEKPSEDVQQALEEQEKYLQSIIPDAQRQVDDINAEIANVNQLTDFVRCLGDMPTELSDEMLAAKLESRFAYINYLQSRKAALIGAMESVEQTIEDVTPVPQTFDKLISIYRQPKPQQTLRQPQGLRAVWRGIRDVLKGRVM